MPAPARPLSVPVSGHPVSGAAQHGRAATGAGLRPALPALPPGPRRLPRVTGKTSWGRRGAEAEKDVTSYTFRDLESLPRKLKCVEVGEPALTPKWILSSFSESCVVFFPLPFVLSSSLRFAADKIAAKFKCICLLMEELVSCCSIISPVEVEKARMYAYCSLAVNTAHFGTYIGLNIKRMVFWN